MTAEAQPSTPTAGATQRRESVCDKIAFGLLLAAAVVSPTQWVLPLSEWLGGIAERVPAVTLLDLLLVFSFAFFTLDVVVRRRWRAIRWLPLPMVILLALGALSITQAGDRSAAIKDWLQWVHFFVIAFMVIANVAAGRRMAAIVAVLAVAATLAAGWAALQYADTSITALGVRSTFENRNTYSAFMAVLIPLLWGGVVFLDNWAERIGLALVALATLATMLCGGAVLAALAGMTVVGAMRSRGWTALVPALALAAIAVPQIAILKNPNLTDAWPRNHVGILDESISPIFGGHEDWQRARQYFPLEHGGDARPTQDNPALPHPRYLEGAAVSKAFQYEYFTAEPRQWVARRMLLGVGIGNFQEHINRYHDALSKYNYAKPAINLTEPGTNSLYAVLALSVGLPALAALLWLGAEGLGRAIRRGMIAAEPFDRAMKMGAAGALVSLGLVSLFAMPLQRGVFFPAILALAIAYAYPLRFPDESTDD